MDKHATALAPQRRAWSFADDLWSLRLGIERGSVNVVASHMADKDFLQLAESLGAMPEVEKASAWLAEAQEFERVNGRGSRLDPDHPWNIEHMPVIRAYWAGSGRRRQPS